MEGEMAYLVLGEPTLADAPGGDRRGNRDRLAGKEYMR
jgi:hypothetical protein